MESTRKIERTEHPHIVKIEGVCGGAAIIEGTRIAVWHIVDFYYKAEMSVEAILLDLGHLWPAQIFDALSYYHDHREEINRLCWENSYEYWQESHSQAAA